MLAHACRELPNEACGMFSAMPGLSLVDDFHPMLNAAASPSAYSLHGQEMLDLERNVDAAGRELVGVMHSHTDTSAYPSPTDVGDSGRFDPAGTYLHMIVSLRDAEPVVRCYRIENGAITEWPVVVTDGDDDSLDTGGAAAAAAVVRLPTRN